MKVEVAKGKSTGLVVTRPVIIITTLNENGVVNGGAFGGKSVRQI
jgi:flavin reductase (DIM6/NTAB) family NADH-FMN oxidoreductase RutF